MTDSQPPNTGTEVLSRFQVLAAMIVTAIILAVVARVWLTFVPGLLIPLNPSKQAIAFGIGLGLAITALSGLVYQFWPLYRKSANEYLELVLKPLLWPDLIWLGLLPGMSEELLFRGVVLPAIGLGVWGIVISSLCFGILHYSGSKHWPYVIWATIVGFLLGSSTILTGSLVVPVIAHITTNLLSSCLWKFQSQGT